MNTTQITQTSMILPIDSADATLELAGGKGANLARLKRAGFLVPDGFLITTPAYLDYLTANGLQPQIKAALGKVDLADSTGLEEASAQIRSLFKPERLSPTLVNELIAAHEALGEGAVAVRSSATAEDLPELSFAGQQDTYLNILGGEKLLQAVVSCWGSLWTARAIAYRLRNHLGDAGLSLAVVVQRMVESQASGVLFTANPLTGLRREMVIDATIGLGEALVSGQVEPDHYVIDIVGHQITSRTLGSKARSVRSQPGGGTQLVEESLQSHQALPDDQILSLAMLGEQVAGLYQSPQDIEWAWAQDTLYLLQSRPITTLFPVPEGMPSEPLKVLFSMAAVQGMLDPLTPIGRDTLQEFFAAGIRLFGIPATRQSQTVLYTAAERLWVNFTAILKNSVGRRAVPVVLSLIEPSIGQAVQQIQDDPPLQPGREGISWSARLKMARFFLPLAANALMNIASPEARRKYIINRGDAILKEVDARFTAIQGDRFQKLDLQADLLPGMARQRLPRMFILFVSALAAGMASWNILNRLAAEAIKNQASQVPGQPDELILQVTRGMPYNPTTEMDLALWEIARQIQKDPASLKVFQGSQAGDLSQRFIKGDMPETARSAIEKFLDRYGGRGLGEIDLGRKRWAEDPTHVFEMLASFLQIKDEIQAPDQVFARSAASAGQAMDRLVASIRRLPHGWLKARAARFFIARARQLMGMRESPKFFIVRMMWLAHREIRKTGQEFVQAGELDEPEDLFFLTINELKAFASRQPRDWRGLIASRRAAYRRELGRRQIPRLLLSDGRAFFEGITEKGDTGNSLTGSPVSPGSVEGRVRVVFDPGHAGLLPGEILVCPGTDPSWTPLFFSASGLVMEVGGMMTHGAVVAREYGIPAIVGVDQATSRLQTGQLIHINGSTGQIILKDK